MFDYKELINQIYTNMDRMIEARGLEKVILATKIIADVNDLEKGLDAIAAQSAPIDENEQAPVEKS